MAPTYHDAPRLTAVLGPTNTGKTHLAVERMLGHRSGMIGLPLRLLAREIYDKVVARVGDRAVALITGEEKLVPARPRYFVCTVEAMPLDRPVDFLAVDEIQLADDGERGHVFTDRLLNARGLEETMFLGADTIRRLVRRLAPDMAFISRPRLSRLDYAGPKKLTRLPPRSAVVTFSANDVYALADVLRRQRGGAAVVLGALSPRTRNAQVALYQGGDVDYMVATDAIGMGLNMDVDHVAFAALRKFDGRGLRALTPAELAQIAGRAGRYMNDGTFGTTGDIGGLDADVVEAIEGHRFPSLRAIYWRNARLRFTSLDALIRSLDAPPPAPGLMRAPDVDDRRALGALAGEEEIRRLAANPDAVRLLWEVCRIPDYRKTMDDAHARLLGRVYTHLVQGDGVLPEDWADRHVAPFDRIDGDIDTLVTRIAHVRTWTYISHRTGWLADPGHWQARTRAIEDRLSDALHDRLTQRFVDQRGSALVRELKRGGAVSAAIDDDGAVAVDGHFIGRLEGFRFVADEVSAPYEGKALWNAAQRALKPEIGRRAAALAAGRANALTLDKRARVLWRGAPVARLIAGDAALRPRLELLPADLLDDAARVKVKQRLDAWLSSHLAKHAKPLLRLTEAELGGAARGIAFQLGEALGAVPRSSVARQAAALTEKDRAALARLGVRIGREAVFLEAMFRPRALRVRALLWAVHSGQRETPPTPPSAGPVLAVDGALPAAFYAAIGYRRFGRRALRVDVVERVAARARRLARAGPFAPGADILALAGCRAEEIGDVLAGLGFRAEEPDAQGVVCYALPERRKRKRRGARPALDPDSPFAKLSELRFGT